VHGAVGERNDEYACQEKREPTQDSGTNGWTEASDLRTQGSLRLTFARCTRQRKEERGKTAEDSTGGFEDVKADKIAEKTVDTK